MVSNNSVNGFYFDGKNFLVDKYPNPMWFVNLDGDRLAPYIVNANGIPIDEDGEFIMVIRRNDIPNNILYMPRQVQQLRPHSPAGMSPPPSPRTISRATSATRPQNNRTQPVAPAARSSPVRTRRTTRRTNYHPSSPRAARNSSPSN
jgi:hypothetical protein